MSRVIECQVTAARYHKDAERRYVLVTLEPVRYNAGLVSVTIREDVEPVTLGDKVFVEIGVVQ